MSERKVTKSSVSLTLGVDNSISVKSLESFDNDEAGNRIERANTVTYKEDLGDILGHERKEEEAALATLALKTVTENQPAPVRSINYRPEIDGLRTIAVIPVMMFHFKMNWTYISGGFAGVDVFFVISGFLITSIMVAELEKEKFSLAMFWERRVRRLFAGKHI